MSKLDSKIPEGPLKDKWTKHKNDINVVNPANKRHIDIIVVSICFQRTPKNITECCETI